MQVAQGLEIATNFCHGVAAARRGGLGLPVPLGGPLQKLARTLVGALLLAEVISGGAASAMAPEHTGAQVTAAAAVQQDAADLAVDTAAQTRAERRAAHDITQQEHLVGHKVYTVAAPKDGYHDNLWDIAERLLGDGRHYREIHELNKGLDQLDGRKLELARLIQPGWNLVMPDDAVGVARMNVAPNAATPSTPTQAAEQVGLGDSGAAMATETGCPGAARRSARHGSARRDRSRCAGLRAAASHRGALRRRGRRGRAARCGHAVPCCLPRPRAGRLAARPPSCPVGMVRDTGGVTVPTTPTPSPLLSLPGAVSGGGVDAPVAAHYGSFNGEQRTLAAGEGFVDLSHRGVIRVSGPDRLPWLHSLTTQHLEHLQPGIPTAALVLSPNGHVEHAMYGVDDGGAFTAHVEPGGAAPLVAWLDRMRFMMRVEVEDLSGELAVAWRPVASTGSAAEGELEATMSSGKYDVLARPELEAYAKAAGPACGMWAYEALRIARGEPRFGQDTDHRTIPNEVGWIPSAVHLDKGCYRGQETVARVHTLGRPPRRLTLLHLDGSDNRLPKHGSPVLNGEREVGYVGSSARHHEYGPIALALIKRNVPVDAELDADGLPALQEIVVDPEVGLHVRPLR
ncbi:MAG: hypothetical protein JWR85_2819 [Marmoricola sp.]|nr:hypothetical protein [Marmoricola sp.]